MRISLLDRSRTRAGETDADAVGATVERAVRADALGLHRFWTAEHHAVPGVASGSPAVLLAAIGARTTRIRIGTGGVMVPNHSPIVVAEQAALLESLFPGRTDLGLGASLGFTPAVRRALRRTTLGDGDVAAEIAEVRSFLEGTAEVTIRPRVAPPPIFMLAVANGLAIAAELGLPAVIGGPLLQNRGEIDAYFREFRPRASGEGPSIIVSVDVSIADTPERARELLLPEAWAFAHSRDIGEFRALQPIDEVRRLVEGERRAKMRAAITRWMSAAIAGTSSDVARDLAGFLERTRASEILASVSTFDRGEVDRMDAQLADLQG